jgi:hypothetical protein
MKNEKSITATAMTKAQFHADERAVMFFTGMGVEELTDYKLDVGKRWLVLFCINKMGLNKKAAEVLWLEPLLLQWWNYEWRRMDRFVIIPMLHKIMDAERCDVYKAMHEGIFLSEHPSNATLLESLGRLVKQMDN